MMKKLLIVCFLFALHTACEKEVVSPIPNFSVRLTLDLMGADRILNGPSSFMVYTKPRIATEEGNLGFGGILVINGIGEGLINLCAYDLACPNEVRRDIRIVPQSSGLQAICPECHAVFNIATGGAPESGSKYWLKRYNVIQTSDTRYLVTN
ncbi:MAG: hypothetical protein FWD60_02110 [Candidatus Azobacteroides sp.]|nr:hypothetical protein [Candidatus Azobacteroides sp.]